MGVERCGMRRSQVQELKKSAHLDLVLGAEQASSREMMPST